MFFFLFKMCFFFFLILSYFFGICGDFWEAAVAWLLWSRGLGDFFRRGLEKEKAEEDLNQGFQRVPCCLEVFKYLRTSKKHGTFVTPGSWRNLEDLSENECNMQRANEKFQQKQEFFFFFFWGGRGFKQVFWLEALKGPKSKQPPLRCCRGPTRDLCPGNRAVRVSGGCWVL